MTIVDCYRLDLSRSDDRDRALLDPYERARAARFRFEKDRTRYIAAHAQVRRLLGLRLGMAPAEVPISMTRRGKPVIGRAGQKSSPAGPADPAAEDSACRFNLSHSGPVGYLAVATCSVGVDVELHRPLQDLQPLIDTYCSPSEIASLAAMAPAQRGVGFLGIWTRKEAALKAWGTGIGVIALDQLHVGVDSQALAARPVGRDALPGEPARYPALQLWSRADAGQVLSVAAATLQATTVNLIDA